MITVDDLLIKIVNNSSPTIEELINAKDARVLRSLASSIGSNFFITENQSRLLVKILRENTKKMPDFSEDITTSLSSPIWSKKFRQLEQVKKLFIDADYEGEPLLVIDFTYSSQFRKILQDISKKCENLVNVTPGKKYTADLTEVNLVVLVDALEPLGFEISEPIKKHYNIIKSWSEQEIKDQFLLTRIEHKNFIKAISSDLGVETVIDQNIINDRSMRYQYFTENIKNHGETLTEVIANRPKNRVWIDKAQHTMTNVVSSILSLRRAPILVVFADQVNSKYYENLEILSTALDENGIVEGVGIYFRLPNDDSGKKFNTLVADKQYNQKMDENLKVAVVMSGKIPKFFLSNPWKPMSVITLDSKMGLRHGKTAVYSNCCDCIVEWAEEPSISEQRIIGTWR
jgi:hypothetical protein